MAFVLLLLAILLFGVILVVIGVVLLLFKTSKLAGLIILGVGLLITLIPILGFSSLGIATRTMG
jgi:hypothetical protein